MYMSSFAVTIFFCGSNIFICNDDIRFSVFRVFHTYKNFKFNKVCKRSESLAFKAFLLQVLHSGKNFIESGESEEEKNEMVVVANIKSRFILVSTLSLGHFQFIFFLDCGI